MNFCSDDDGESPLGLPLSGGGANQNLSAFSSGAYGMLALHGPDSGAKQAFH